MQQPKFTPPPHFSQLGSKSSQWFALFSVIVLIPLLFISCLEDAEKIESKYELANDDLSVIRNWFETHKEELRINDSGINFRTENQELILPFFEKEPDWNKFHIYEWPDGRKVYEVNLANKEIVLTSEFTDNMPQADPSKTVIQNIMFVENRDNGRYDPVIARYYPADEYSVSGFHEISYNKIGAGWSGTVDIWTYDERYFVGFIIEDGQLTATKHPEGYDFDQNTRKIGLNGENLDVTCRHVVSITTVVTIVSAGGGSHISYKNETSVHMVCSGGSLGNNLGSNGNTGTTYPFNSGGGGSGGGTSAPSGQTYTPPTVVRPILINQLSNPCASGIFLSLKRGNNSPMFIGSQNPLSEFSFAEEIYNLFENSKKFDLIIKNANLSGVNGSTVSSLNRNTGKIEVTITLSNNYLGKATKLSIARTIIHEMVHGFINYELNSGNFEFSSYFNKNFEKYLTVKNPDMNRAHHELMGAYVDMIAFSLKKWDFMFGDGLGNLGDDYYKAMAFGGLFKTNTNIPTDSFKELIPNSNERTRIINIIRNEQEGNSNAKGKKCN